MLLNPLPKSFYERDAALVAREILGKILVRRLKKRILSGRIVETEAYYGTRDPASRAFGGKITNLNKWMWSRAGTVFVYMVHGNWLFNIITGKINEPCGILIRAVEPIEGIEIMMRNRCINNIKNLTSGPGKLTKAFNITNIYTGLSVLNQNSEIIIIEDKKEKFEISSSHRIGVRRDLDKKLRFYIDGNEFVSKI